MLCHLCTDAFRLAFPPLWSPLTCLLCILFKQWSFRLEILCYHPRIIRDEARKSLEWVATVIAFDCEELWCEFRGPSDCLWFVWGGWLQSWHLWHSLWVVGDSFGPFYSFHPESQQKRWHRLAQMEGAASWLVKPRYDSVDRYPF